MKTLRLILFFLLAVSLLCPALCLAEADPVTDPQTDYAAVRIAGVTYRLGESTVEDFAAQGWPYTVEEDGMFSLLSAENESYLYVRTADGAPSSPIVDRDLFWADGVLVEYCGFDQTGARGEERLGDWLTLTFETEESEEGVLTAQTILPGRATLWIETDGYRVRLSLTTA